MLWPSVFCTRSGRGQCGLTCALSRLPRIFHTLKYKVNHRIWLGIQDLPEFPYNLAVVALASSFSRVA